MKKLIALFLATVLVLSLSACKLADKDTATESNKPEQTEESKFQYHYDIKEHITVGSYSNEIDKNSTDYGYAEDSFYDMTFGDKLVRKVTSGLVKNGDVANIDYKGLLNGVAFDGGTASGYDLTIGSNSFIDGFEEGLIGAEIGKKVSLNLKFPEVYHSAELAGKAVVFEVTVNYVTESAEPSDENIKEFGYASLSEYENAKADYASSFCLFYNIYRATKVDNYPDREKNLLYDYSIENYENLCKQNNITMSELASANNLTLDQLYEYITENEVYAIMEYYMVAYYILQTNNVELTEADIEAKRAALDEQYEEPLDSIGYNEINIQQAAAFDKALKLLSDDVIIKN